VDGGARDREQEGKAESTWQIALGEKIEGYSVRIQIRKGKLCYGLSYGLGSGWRVEDFCHLYEADRQRQ